MNYPIWTSTEVDVAAKVFLYPPTEYSIHINSSMSDDYDMPFFGFGPIKSRTMCIEAKDHKTVAFRINKMNSDLAVLLSSKLNFMSGDNDI